MRSPRKPAPALLLGLLLPLGATDALPVRCSLPVIQAAERISLEDYDLLDFDRRRGKLRDLEGDLEELLEEAPGDFLVRSLRGRLRYERCEYDGALDDARQALEQARGADAPAAERALCTRNLAWMLLELGRAERARAVLEDPTGGLDPRAPRDAWLRGRALLAAGEREQARTAWRAGAQAEGRFDWADLLAQARCQRALGRIREASSSLVAADRLARRSGGVEPDVLVELGEVYFEAYGEVDDQLSRAHSPAELYREALRLNPDHEGARLALLELVRFNWRRTRESAGELLAAVFEARPRSIRGLIARCEAALENGDLKSARRDLASLQGLAPDLRRVLTLRATLAWIEHRRDETRELLDALAERDPADGVPERELGKTLLELYRFAEAKPFLESSVRRDPSDWVAWTLLGRAQANTGDEEAGLASLQRAEDAADGRRDAWRANMTMVLERMDRELVLDEREDLSFRWMPDAAPVLSRYLVPFYESAREELAERYGFTPDPVRIEVFRRWEDFSVRSTGFEGYPALGVCFGPVVTAVSPLSRLRGTFSWARTSYHEFTHVIHLGLSHNRCPRWITEGLATWEEGRRSGAWWRNLRREMLDARANGEVIPIRHLNEAFRGPRVIFAYYEGGLICEMLVETNGFAPMVRLLEAFDAGADLDGALGDVFGKSPEELDRDLAAFVDRKLAGLVIEPRWSRETTFKRRFSLTREPPQEGREAWQEEWCRAAWGAYWARELVDAREALRLARAAGELPARGLFLRGELAVMEKDLPAAREALERGFELGGEDFRARMLLGSLTARAGEEELAEEHFRAAERDFPGYDDPAFSAELQLARLLDGQGRGDEANEARLRWLAFNAGNYDVHFRVAAWLERSERYEEAARLYEQTNEIDPFRRHLHLVWGRTLMKLGRHEEALREFEAGLAVPRELDGDLLGAGGPALAGHGGAEQLVGTLDVAGEGEPDPIGLDERFTREEAYLKGWRALALVELGRPDEARVAAEEALAQDDTVEPARRAKERLP